MSIKSMSFIVMATAALLLGTAHADLVAHWSLDDGAGDVARDASISVLFDTPLDPQCLGDVRLLDCETGHGRDISVTPITRSITPGSPPKRRCQKPSPRSLAVTPCAFGVPLAHQITNGPLSTISTVRASELASTVLIAAGDRYWSRAPMTAQPF